jgi:transposase-like protein
VWRVRCQHLGKSHNPGSGIVKLRRSRQTDQMKTNAPTYHGWRFPPDIISHAVWLYHRFCLSFRDVEDLLAQRGITVSYETI